MISVHQSHRSRSSQFYKQPAEILAILAERACGSYLDDRHVPARWRPLLAEHLVLRRSLDGRRVWPIFELMEDSDGC